MSLIRTIISGHLSSRHKEATSQRNSTHFSKTSPKITITCSSTETVLLMNCRDSTSTTWLLHALTRPWRKLFFSRMFLGMVSVELHQIKLLERGSQPTRMHTRSCWICVGITSWTSSWKQWTTSGGEHSSRLVLQSARNFSELMLVNFFKSTYKSISFVPLNVNFLISVIM